MPRGKRRPVVLHVEDDTPTQHRRADILRDAGCFVSRVRTVQEALTAVSKKRPDVILCDVKLPDGTGFQICREMLNAQPPVPVILISDLYRDESAHQSGVFVGASEYLMEPVTPEQLVAAVTRQIT
jgi:DNA-binding response OmpR family regulator